MIEIVDVDNFLKLKKAKGPVKSSQFFLGKSQNPHPDGLFSEVFFGIDGSPEYRTKYSWIDLNCPVIHPLLFDILCKRIERKIEPLLSGEKTYIINDDGNLEEKEDGNIDGMTKLYENRMKWKFKRNVKEVEAESERDKLVSMLEKNIQNDLFFMTKLLVLPPTFRPMVMLEEDVYTADALNEIYQKVIILANQLSSVSGILFDVLTYRMQMLMRELYDLSRQKASKKSGMVRNYMLGERMDFSARAVISPNPYLQVGEVGIPLRIVCQLFEPNILYGLANSPYSHTIPQNFHAEVKKFLGKSAIYDDE